MIGEKNTALVLGTVCGQRRCCLAWLSLILALEIADMRFLAQSHQHWHGLGRQRGDISQHYLSPSARLTYL